jgi:hypothetical protein
MRGERDRRAMPHAGETQNGRPNNYDLNRQFPSNCPGLAAAAKR